jgi:uncharacterized repeat protein (TIGR01451 family)
MHRLARPAPRSLLLCILLLRAATVCAQPAFLVKDINTSTFLPASPVPSEMVAAGGLVFLPLDDGIHGKELWRSDGTATGTYLLADICPGICGSSPDFLTAFNGNLYFGAGGAFWMTDGTRAGTVKLLDLGVADLAQVNGKLVISAITPFGDSVLGVSDGTAAGTLPLGSPAENPIFLGSAGSTLFFKAEDFAHGRELWKTDGTLAGTSLVKDLVPGSPDSFSPGLSSPWEKNAAVGGRLFFSATAQSGDAGGLWVTDGTEAGTYRVNDLVPGSSWSNPQSLTARGGDVVFFASTPAGGGELWRTDGTADGTVRLRAGGLPSLASHPRLALRGGEVFFQGIDEAGAEPWKTDGTPAGTVRVADVNPGPGDAYAWFLIPGAPAGSGLLFSAAEPAHGNELWTTDGTAAGTTLLADLSPGAVSSSVSPGILAEDGRSFFGLAPDGEADWALWVSDGTAAGTQLVHRFPTQRSSLGSFPLFTPLAGTQLFFRASDIGTAAQPGIWTSDGTAAGTVKLAPTGGVPSLPAPLSGLVVFASSFGGLWRTDGMAGGTWKIPGSPSSLGQIAGAGSQVFFSGYDNGLWTTDGTTGVTALWSGPIDSFTLTAFGSHALCSSFGTVLDSDGTAAGTVAVVGETPYHSNAVVPAGDRFFFIAADNAAGVQLWVKEASAPRAHRIDVQPRRYLVTFQERPVALRRNVVFRADDGNSGIELWGSDGTAAGTALLADIRPGKDSSTIADLTPGRDKVWFTADDGVHGRELWVTDGTAAGTHLVRDIVPGAGSSYPQQLRVIGHVLLFSAFDAAHGLEVWRSDGTEAGTHLLQDIASGPEPSSPQGFTAAGPYVYFSANDNATGFEPWAIPRAALGSALAATKTVSGQGSEGATVTYTIVITNVGAGPSTDNPGNEMTDVLPAGLTLLDASATTGTAAVDLPANRVTWNGALPIGGTATVTIHATVASGAFPGLLLNQAALAYDGDGNGTNESAAVSDGPSVGAPTPLNVSMAAMDFYTAAPCRVVDTRNTSPLASGVARTFNMAGSCGIPVTAKAVAANIAVVVPSGDGYVSIYPAGTLPGTSTVNFQAGQVRAGNAVLALKNGAVDAKATVGGSGTVQVVIDVSGYFQ